MSILFKKSGVLTTVQDLGRNGYRRFGINPNGAMDQIAVRLINCLLGNDENCPVLEMHFPAPEILFEKPAFFTLGGADFSAELDGNKIENWRIYYAPPSSKLKFLNKTSGNRAYFAVKNGFTIEAKIGSASTNLKAKFGGFQGRTIASGDRIELKSNISKAFHPFNYKISNSILPIYSGFPTIRIVAGAEFEELTAISQQNLLKTNFKISASSDRMGYRLQGKPLYLLNSKELISSAVNFGTIQLLPDGQIIVLMADHQTTGGYPRIAHVIPSDLPLLAQLGANDQAAFHLVTLEEAEIISAQFEKNLKMLEISVKFREEKFL